MSAELTRITEIITGLGTLSDHLSQLMLLDSPPAQLQGVSNEVWQMLRMSHSNPSLEPTFQSAFNNGQYFLRADLGLRGRVPLTVEWKGLNRPPEHDPPPADLRIDGVYLVSCKYLSKILLNPSPVALFEGALTQGARRGADWYSEVADNAYQRLYRAACRLLGLGHYPKTVGDLSRDQRVTLKHSLIRKWPPELRDEVKAWITAVSERSATRLRQAVSERKQQERLYWRFMRLQSAPYFVLGTSSEGSMRLMVQTPWDFQRRYKFLSLDVQPLATGQPAVKWTLTVIDKARGERVETVGHIEIRWSHGKFMGAPEAKVYLDTPHEKAVGYEPF